MKAPKHWPVALRREFDSPIAVPAADTKRWDNGNLAVGFEMRFPAYLEKLGLLAKHYEVSDKLGGGGAVQLLFLLCEDIFDGFNLKWHPHPKALANSNQAKMWFVLSVETIMRRFDIGALRACRKLKEFEPKKYPATAISLKTRYMEAKKNPDVRMAVDLFATLTPQEWDKLAAVATGTK